MNYAIVDISGHQYVVAVNDVITVDKIDGQAKSDIKTDKVLLIVDDDKVTLGTPYVANASVGFQIVEHKKGQKIDIFTYKAKSRYRKRKGFRPQLTDIKIISIDTKKAKVTKETPKKGKKLSIV